MRQMLAKSKDGSIYLNDELEIIKGYLELERIRHEEKFEYSVTNTTNMNVLIPSLVIQSVAENAVIHGVQGARNNISVEIVNCSNNSVEVVVINTGCMNDIQYKNAEAWNDTNALGINRNRLENYTKILKHATFGIQFESNEVEQETKVTICIPNLSSYERINS